MTTNSLFLAGQHPLDRALVRDIFALGNRSKIGLYLVGGYLRDCINGQDSTTLKDVDFAVLGMPALDFAHLVAEEFKGHYVLLDNLNDVARVVIDDGPTLDFAGCVGGSLSVDIQR